MSAKSDEKSTKTAPGHAPDSVVPERIGPYRILRKIGQGGMGVVYEAEQKEPRRKVALKVVRGGQVVDDRRMHSFRREVDALARLKHPSIGAIYESGRTEDDLPASK